MSITLDTDPVAVSLPHAVASSANLVLATLSAPDRQQQFHALRPHGRLKMREIRAMVDAIGKESPLPVAVCSPLLDASQKEALAAAGIAYIQDRHNAFLPFIGAIARSSPIEAEAGPLSPSAQRIVINLISGDWSGRTAGDLAGCLGKSNASVTKYLVEISAIRPDLIKTSGKSKVVGNPNISKQALLETFGPYLVNPIAKTHRLSKRLPTAMLNEAGAKLAGGTALAFYSDLAHDARQMTVALDAAGLSKLKNAAADLWVEAPWFDDAILNVQEWNHAIDGFDKTSRASTGLDCLTAESLYEALCHETSDDIRTADAIEQLRELICQR
jgi:hypothetical protein